MSKINLFDVIRLVHTTPGQDAGEYRRLLNAPKRVIGRALRAAEKLGIVASTKVESNRIWFLATAVAS